MAQSPQLTPPTEFEQAETIEAVDHGGGGLPQLEIDTFPSQIFWLVVALVVLYFLMSRIALPRIASVLEERADAIAGDLDRADELKRRAEQAEQAYKQALADARAEAQTIAARTRAEIQVEVDEATARADAEIAARAAEGEQRIAAIRESAAADVRQVAGEAAVAVVERILPGLAGEDDVRQAVNGRLERG